MKLEPLRSRALLLAATLAGLACMKPPEVTSAERASGRGGDSGQSSSPSDRGAGGSGGAGSSSPPSLSLPDAAQGAPDLAPPMAETCAEESHAPTRVPLDVFILLDGSGSMSLQIGMKTKLQIVRDAINAFLADPNSAGLGVGLSIFPSVTTCETDADCPMNGTFAGRCTGYDSGCVVPGQKTATRVCSPAVTACPAPSTCVKVGRCPDPVFTGYCTIGSTCASGADCMPMVRTCSTPFNADCTGARYAKPLVTFGELPGALPALKTALDLRQPTGGTPLAEALKGTLPLLKTYMAAHPDRRVVLLIASDGAPDGFCEGQMGILAGLREANAAMPSLSTYGIGVFGAVDFANGRMLMDDIATAGGTMKPYVLDQNTNLAETFLKALSEIRGSALPCEFMIPTGNTAIDYDKVNLRWKNAAGEETVGYVGSPDRCDPQKGGWHYDVDPKTGGKPTRVVVCPATCTKLKSDDSGKVDLRFGCKTRAID
jgi:Mg-chelatase subunit ChlD